MPFTLTNSVSADGDIDVREYKSSTGLTLIVCQVPGPIVHGYLAVATEAHDNEGVPHTLEHLCFLGSEDYPYKGILDQLANRSLATGTNAWTDTDHTAYTISTAGPDGFLNILPVYLDHILYPVLTDEAYTTEIHHINGKGEDAGVVYCEMQGRENTGESILYREFLNAMYPGDCGYKSETGGLLKDIRESLSNEKIRKYHSEFYRPENLCITVCGQIRDEDLIAVISKYEEKIISKNRTDPYQRPWQSPVPPLVESVVRTFEYPCDDNENGMAWMGWRGPSCVSNFQETIPLALLSDYLSDNAISPLQQKFVEVDDPYCAEVQFSLIENSESCCFFTFDSTDTKKAKDIGNVLLELLKSIASSPQDFDMERMKSVIHRKKMQLLLSLESRPHSHVCNAVIGAFLYAQKPEDLATRLTQIPYYEEAQKRDAQYWCSLITQYFLAQPYVLIIGQPSQSMQKSVAQAEKDRIAQRIASLGPSVLEEKGKIVERAITVNSRPPPPEILQCIPIASTDSVSYHSVKQFNTDNHSELINSPIPYKMQVDDVNSNFINMTVFMNTTSDPDCSDFDAKLRPYLPLLCTLITESAIDRNGTIIPYQDVINQLDSDTIDSSVAFGLSGHFTQLFGVRIQSEMEKYVQSIKWLHELLFKVVFEEERISVVLKKMLNDLNTKKREGSLICRCIVQSITYDSRSNEYIFILHEQIKFLKSVAQKLKKDPSVVINDLNSLRSIITRSENILIHLSMNQAKVAQVNGSIDLFTPWMDVFVPVQVRQASLSRVTRPIAQLKDLFVVPQSPEKNGIIVGLGSVDSAYMETRLKFALSPTDPNLPALLVLSEYLSQMEGPLWQEIRGPGLAYGCSIRLNIHENSIALRLYRSTNVHEAYRLSRQIVEKLISCDGAWDMAKLEASKSSLIYSLITREKSLNAAARESFLYYLLNLDQSHGRDLIAKIAKLDTKEVIKVVATALKDLFSDEIICKSVVCNTSAVDDFIQKFKEMNVTLTKFDVESDINIDSKL